MHKLESVALIFPFSNVVFLTNKLSAHMRLQCGASAETILFKGGGIKCVPENNTNETKQL